MAAENGKVAANGSSSSSSSDGINHHGDVARAHDSYVFICQFSKMRNDSVPCILSPSSELSYFRFNRILSLAPCARSPSSPIISYFQRKKKNKKNYNSYYYFCGTFCDLIKIILCLKSIKIGMSWLDIIHHRINECECLRVCVCVRLFVCVNVRY